MVSHAHADHAREGSRNVYCTQVTSEIMQLRYKHKAAKAFYLKPFRESFEINGVRLEFIAAGHILGSAQILMEYDGVRYLYSGDIKLQEDATCESTDFVYADVLITETTFAKKDFIHPNVVEEVQQLQEAALPFIIGTYVLGKAQRLNYLLNELKPNSKIYVHYDILPYHKIYERNGIRLGNYEVLDKKNLKHARTGFYLVPPLSYQSYKIRYPYDFAFASGWLEKQEPKHRLLLSDHIDWSELLEYIRKVNPKEIWTIHGDGRDLQDYFKNSSIIVKEIEHERVGRLLH